MDKRKSFILHFDSLDILEELSKEQIADLFIAIRDYNLWKEVELSWLMKAVFIPFKNQFNRDLEKYKKKCEVNAENVKKRWNKENIPTDTNYTTGINGIPTDTNYTYNDSKSDNKSDSDNDNKNKLILSKDNEQSSLIKIDNRKNDINEMQEIIKDKILSLWLIYKQGKQERNRIQNILTAKDFWEICDKSNMSRENFVLNIIELSTKLEFWKWKIYNAETLYKHYASVYNEAVRIKTEWQNKKAPLIV